MSCCLLLCLSCSKEEEDNSFRQFLQWLCCKKWRLVPFFGGFATKKVMVAISSPSSMVVGL